MPVGFIGRAYGIQRCGNRAFFRLWCMQIMNVYSSMRQVGGTETVAYDATIRSHSSLVVAEVVLKITVRREIFR